MSRCTWKEWFSRTILQKKNSHPRRKTSRLPRLESLGERITPAVNAFFGQGVLTVMGDSLDNTIEVSRNAAGGLLVNGGAVQILGGSPTVANTTQIMVYGLSGHDSITLNETNGALPASSLFGGVGND